MTAPFKTEKKKRNQAPATIPIRSYLRSPRRKYPAKVNSDLTYLRGHSVITSQNFDPSPLLFALALYSTWFPLPQTFKTSPTLTKTVNFVIL